MTISPGELTLYAGALLALFLTPGPVWVAVIARTLSGGFQAAWPLALGVAVGDMFWPLTAVYGLNWITSTYGGFIELLRWVAVGIFLLMGLSLLRRPDRVMEEDSRLIRPGVWAGFLAGVAVILGNPKAILFYLGILPGFFDLSQITSTDMVAIVALSMIVPLAGNLGFSLAIGQMRNLANSPQTIRRLNQGAGLLLLGVGVVIALG